MPLHAEAIRIPDELVYFSSPSLQKVLLLNPELGTYAVVPQHILPTLRLMALPQPGAAGAPSGAQPPSIERELQTLIVRRVIYYGNFRPAISDHVPPVPAAVYWETTHGCSLRCNYCYMSADTVLPGELTTEEAESLIRQCADLGVHRFVFTGGEPLVRRDLFRLGAYAKERGLFTEIITNATLVTSAEVAEAVRDTFDAVITSLDGATPEANDVHRGSGSFERIVEGIRRLNAAGVVPILNCTISEHNVSQVARLLEFTQEAIRTRMVRLINISFIGRGEHSQLQYNWDTYQRTFEQIRQHNARQLEHVAAVPAKNMLSPRKNCGMGSGEIYVDSLGRVFPCKLVTRPDWYAGSVKEQDLGGILQAQALERARQLSVDEREGCRTCVIRRLCGGGCRGMHMGYSGDPLVNDPQFCWLLRHQMVTNLWSLEGCPRALQDDEAVVPRRLVSGAVWKPELGTALPEHMLQSIARHLSGLQGEGLPLA